MLYLISRIYKGLQNKALKIRTEIRKKYWSVLNKDRFSAGDLFFFALSSKIHLDNSGSVIKLGNYIQVRDYCFFRSEQNGIIDIADNVFFNNSCSINCMGSIKVGSDCQFGEGVKLYDHNHKHTDQNELISQQGYTIGEIAIGENCWIGSNVTILKDVHIGDNVIIGAGCVIHKSVPSNSIVLNNQHLIIKSRLSI